MFLKLPDKKTFKYALFVLWTPPVAQWLERLAVA